jgi:hypothetical protein
MMQLSDHKPSQKLIELAEKLQGTWRPITISKRELLAHFKLGRLTDRIRTHIRRELERLKINTIPELRNTPATAREETENANEFKIVKLAPEIPEEPATIRGEVITGKIEEIPLATQEPIFISPKDTCTDGGYAKLLTSGNRGFVVVVEYEKSEGSNKTNFRKAKGIITWESYARAFTEAISTGSPLLIEKTSTRDSHITHVPIKDQLSEHYYKSDGFLILTDKEENIVGAVSRVEIGNYLASSKLFPYYQLGVIEHLLREQIRAASIPEEEIVQAIGIRSAEEMTPVVESLINHHFPPEVMKPGKKQVKEFLISNTKQKYRGIDELNFSDYESIYDSLFKKLGMHGSGRSMRQVISKIRKNRNDLMHFKKNLNKNYIEIFIGSISSLLSLRKEK